MADIGVPDIQKISHSLRRRYILALSIIALLVVFSQVLIQFALNDQESDSRVINIAGRQRMLSQRISKCALLLEYSPSETQLFFCREEIRYSVDLWAKSHVGLQRGDAELGLPGNNSSRIMAMFNKIEPQFQAIVRASKVIDDGDAVQRRNAVATILDNQAEFLEGMDEIVFQYDVEAKNKVNWIKQMETSILVITFITLILEACYIFRPAEKHIQRTFEEYRRSESGFKRLFDIAPTPMMMLTPHEYGVVRINHAASNLLNISKDEAGKWTFSELLNIRDEEAANWRSILSRDSVAGIELPMFLRGNDARVLAFTTHTSFAGKPHLVLGLVDITDKHIQHKQLELFAAIDDMTGLLNRRAFLEKLDIALNKAKQDNQELSLAFLDIDGLKKVNDTYGHQEGDWYISTVAFYLRDMIRKNDFSGRLGGDEFAIAFPDCPRRVAEKIVHHIQAQVESLAVFLGKPYAMGISIGVVSTRSSGDEEDSDSLLCLADNAMYQQKNLRHREN
ncbi:putative diguanylate cyclase YdaM [Sporomusa ovata DSM 2662]|uniref:Diguanylate cyclase/phosphodiesterase (GGDEF & EAL domains) with PAS/PAC sensor(S) n=1 Tax=Sporomusa ovata TaxID=2378 RepID=A0A0U1KUU3_9FIRM|nr:diguanylate cyclase [Sporomusa ovata]EQB26942.1 diguanylate cyclase (GGDEF) domain-containing protein [Sporomusa ovata DSM 2662]CQR71045.1 diguanylate cyclase/phosphodiesterase (GGDEF & EAL domains) with PAS/PAC sensor(s) [Sporomusa ovata]